MTRVKMCGMTSEGDVINANELKPDYIGFVFAKNSRRFVAPQRAQELKKLLDKDIKAVGVFVDENIETVSALIMDGTIDIAQLHGNEDDNYITLLRERTGKPVIKAFRIRSEQDVLRAEKSKADMILLDAGAGEGRMFDWSLLKEIKRPYFLAGGLNPENAADAVKALKPYAVDVSTGIETNGVKDREKMTAFADAVRKEE